MTGLKIISTGKGLPRRAVTNDDLSQVVDTSDEWIRKRTGMQVRCHVDETENSLSLAAAAGREAIEAAVASGQVSREDIKVVLVATLSADNYTPSTACLLQKELGLGTDIIALDINSACSGFVFGMETLRGLLMSTGAKAGLLVGVEVLSRKLDMTDRGTCVLFGDGAAAAVATLDESKLYRAVTGVQSDWDMIHCQVPDGHITMDGQGTYKFAVATVPGLIKQTVEAAGLDMDEIDCFLMHQANLRIIESIATKLKQPMEKFVVNIEKYGNTSAASVGLAMADANEAGRLKRGDKVLICAFGAGKSYGAVVMEW